MQGSTCSSCLLLSRSRFHRLLIELQNGRRRVHSRRSRQKAQPHPNAAESWYWQTTPPTRTNLAAADHFFKHNSPTRIWTGEGWRDRQNDSQELPEIIFLGRSNVGKSSIINALTSCDINRVSSVPGATKAMAAWTLAAKTPEGGAIKGWDGDVNPKLTLVDMPGYGHGSQTEWGNSIVEYLSKRRNIRRAFVLIDVLHGIWERDLDILKILGSSAIPYQIVATKCDRFAHLEDIEGETRSAFTKIRSEAYLDVDDSLGLGEIIATGFLDGITTKNSTRIWRGAAFGIPNLQWAVLRAAGLETYAMQKAESHGVLKKFPAEDRVLSSQEDSISEDGGQESSQNESSKMFSIPSTSSGPETSVSVEDFLRDILNSPLRQASTRQPPKPASKRAKIFFSLTEDQYMPSHSWKPSSRSSLLDDWLEDAESPSDMGSSYTGNKRQDYSAGKFNETSATKSDAARRRSSTGSSAPMWSHERSDSRTSPDPRGTASSRDQPAPSRKGVAHTVDALGAMSRPSSNTDANANAHHSQPPISGGKGVLRGMDALEAMSGFDSRRSSNPKSRPLQASKGHGNGKGNGKGQWSTRGTNPSSPSAYRDRHPDSTRKEQSRPAAPGKGKGVTRGMDALEAMLGGDSAHGRKTGSQRRK
ncbi:hypothetical protein A1O3_06225 [Capronia epimyces CBS 606.96]|uniref:EngB-type G domain-containing protein n=1 Tax=Capronia epimyces CBS 606.96 TaxID=1182542 RepID=W9XPG0_9EURO|nr:uncharacterized protein A1O3_06225 [Capronia epimyces CBS 606.96]EXJ82412.1 hypothetical protein A1O3_06225 [Capronia epimyces CBS 606.96]